MKLLYDSNISNKLVQSSHFFLIPAIYAYYIKNHWFACMHVIIYIGSVNYWRCASNSWRRTADIYISRASYVYHMYHYQRISKWCIYLSLLTVIMSYYHDDKRLGPVLNTKWVPYHMCFHFFCAMGAWGLI